MQNLEIPPCSLGAECERLRQAVREFLAQELPDRSTAERMRNKHYMVALVRHRARPARVGMS